LYYYDDSYNMSFSDDLIHNCLAPYGFAPSLRQSEQIRVYSELLLNWNKKLSLTAITVPTEILRIHFGESIFAATVGIVGTGRLADVGTGAGFPGIPLAIAISEMKVTLIEPNLKKTVFLSEVKRELQLDNVQISRAAMADFCASGFDYITARALGRFEELLDFASKHTREAGRVVLWLGDEDAKELPRTSVTWRWREPHAIPLSDRRRILVGENHTSLV